MSIMVVENAIQTEPVAVHVRVDNKTVFIELHDDRVISFPARKFSRLKNADDTALSDVRIRAQGTALRWESLDEDISVDGILRGFFELD